MEFHVFVGMAATRARSNAARDRQHEDQHFQNLSTYRGELIARGRVATTRKGVMTIGKVVILAGGLGSRLAEETEVRPKPLVEIGGRPILWHIMKIYSKFGLYDFVICLGYKGYLIKEYFANYHLHVSDVTFDLSNNTTIVHHRRAEPWRVTLVDTGDATMTGGRILRVREHVGDLPFCLTYGDGVADIDISALLAFHQKHGLLATITAVQPPGRFGALEIDRSDKVLSFREKPRGDDTWINGGFLVLSPKVIDTIDGDGTVFERAPLQRLSADGQLAAYRHTGFWHPMDTLRDKRYLEELWLSGRAPWRT
jgi:glucose-1-phosphate cytidylyltransferase